MEVYKVANKVPDVVGYLRGVGESSMYRVSYRIGHKTFAVNKTMGLFCFKTLKDAQNFRVSSECIFKAEGHGLPYQPKYVCRFSHNLLQFYKCKRSKKSIKELSSPAPWGTVCFPAITIGELVE